MNIANRDFEKEFEFKASRSSGPGGQNVNKVNTKVSLKFDIDRSQLLSSHEKEVLKTKLAGKISQGHVIVLTSEGSRSQLRNKEEVVEKFHQLLQEAFARKKKRRPTKPTKESVEKRLQMKQKTAEKKRLRSGRSLED